MCEEVKVDEEMKLTVRFGEVAKKAGEVMKMDFV